MQGPTFLHLAVAALVLLPASGCLDTGGEWTRRYGEGCPQQATWNEPGAYDRLAEEGLVEPPAKGLAFNASSTSLAKDLEIRSVKWQPPGSNTWASFEFQLGVHRFDADVVVLEAVVPEHREDELDVHARAFVENVTRKGPEAVNETVETWLANEEGTAVEASPDGTEINVTAYEAPTEGPFGIEELVQRTSIERRPGSAPLDSFVLAGEAWRFGGTTAIARATATADNRSVEVKANAFDDVAVNFANGTADVAPSPEIINATFDRLGLPQPDPVSWGTENPCLADGEQPRVPSWLGD